MIQFINHILLLKGRLNTEIDRITQSSIRNCFYHARLIGHETTREKLVEYSNNVKKKFIYERIRYFSYSMKSIDSFIIMAANIFENAIIHNNMTMADMLSVQFSI